MKTSQPKYWVSPAPSHCDSCNTEIKDVFYDASATPGRLGPWGCFCPQCFMLDNLRTGTGYGQKYEKQADGRWLKTEG